MSLKIDRVQLEIEIGNDKARMKMRELEAQMRTTTKETKSVERAIADTARKITVLGQTADKAREQEKALTTELQATEAALVGLKADLDKNTASLAANEAALRKMAEAGETATAEYELLEEQTSSLRNRVASLNASYTEANTKLQSQRKALAETQATIEHTTAKMAELRAENKKNSARYAELEQQLKETRLEQDRLIEGIGLNALSMRELSARARELKALLVNMSPSSESWQKTNAQLVQIEGRMSELRHAGRETQSTFDRLADRMNRYQTILQATALAIVGVVYELNQFIRSISEMSDTIGGVMRTTGMTADQVRELKQEFKDFDTRTASTDLLEYARQAGKLGIKGKEEIKGFVREADIAVVALGKDLGNSAEETINTLGKIVGAFQIDDTMGWAEGMKHVGAMINTLGMSSTAGEAEIVNYMARLASVGVSLKVPVSNIAAIGSTLDSLKVPAEQGSTAVQQFMFTLTKHSKDMARFIGVSEAEYKKMVEEDLTAVMIRVLKTAKSGNTGLMQMTQQLDDMNVNGVRMTNTVSQLTNNVEELERQMKIASDEFRAGTSTLNEYDIMTNNFAGRMAKVRKEIAEVVYSLGMFLEGLIIVSAEGLASFFQWLQRNGAILAMLGKTLIVAATAVVSYTAAVRLAVFWSKAYDAVTRQNAISTALKTVAERAATLATAAYRGATLLTMAAMALLTGNTVGATQAMRAFTLATRMNPVGLLIAAITTAVAAFIAFREEAEKNNKWQEKLSETTAKEVAPLEILIEKLKLRKQYMTDTSKVIKEINDRYGAYLPNLLTEKSTLEDIAKAYEAIKKGIVAKIEAQVREEELTELVEKRLKLEEAYQDKLPAALKARAEARRQMSSVQATPGAGADALAKWLQYGRVANDAEQEFKDLVRELEETEQRIDKLLEGIVKKSEEAAAKLDPTKPKPPKGDDNPFKYDLPARFGLDYYREEQRLIRQAVLDEAQKTKTALEEFDEEQEALPDKEANYLTQKWQKTFEGRMAMLEAEYNSELISYAEFLDKKNALLKEQEDEATRIAREQADKRKLLQEAVFESASKLSSAYASFQQSQMARDLEAAGSNERRKEAIKKEYARKQQKTDIAIAMLNQAKGITEIWGKWAWNPAVAAGLTAVELLVMGAQIAAIRSQQFAAGRYNVVGASDGQTYRNVPYVGPARTGLVTRPALVAERGSEMIIDHKTLFSPLRDHTGMTAMDHARAITALRYNTTAVPQYAEGRYVSSATAPSAGDMSNFATRDDLAAVLRLVAESNAANAAMVRNITVTNDPRETIDKYDAYKRVENRANGVS